MPAKLKVSDLKTDPVVRGCLARIQDFDLTAVGVLADYLEENSLPGARSVRRWWSETERSVRYWSVSDIPPNRWYVRWEAVAMKYRRLRWEVGRLFKTGWHRHPITYKFRDAAIAAVRAYQDERAARAKE